MLYSIINYPRCIVSRACYIIDISLLQLHFSIIKNGAFYKDLYKDALLQDLHNNEQSVQSLMIYTTLNDLYYTE